MIDERFVGRVYKTSALVFAFVLLALMAYSVAPAFAWGFLVGYFVAVLWLASLELVVNRAFTAGTRRTKARYGAVAILKFAAVAGIIYGVVRTDHVSLPGFVVGFSLIHAVIALKAVGAVVMEGQSQKGRPAGGE